MSSDAIQVRDAAPRLIADSGPPEVPPGFEQKEVGLKSEEWRSVPLSRISDFITKGSTPTTYGFNWEGSGILFLRSECVSPHGLDLGQSMFISPAAHEVLRRSEVRDGDLLITITGNVGRVVLLGGVGRANINQHIARVRISGRDVDRRYVYHVLSQPSFRRKFESITTGQAYPQISLQQVRTAEVPLPKPPEQRAIAEVLSDVDGLLGALEALIAKKRAIKQSAMQQLLTGKTRLPGFSGEWKTKRLGKLFRFRNGLNKAKRFFGRGTPIVNYMDVFASPALHGAQLAGRVQLSRQEIENFDVRRGDVFLTRTSETVDEIGTAAVVLDDPEDTVYSGFVLRARPLDQSICDPYKVYCFASEDVRRQIVSTASYTTRALTNGRLLSRVSLPVPPTDEQTAIATVLSDMDAEIAALEAQRDKTRAIKQGMMQQLLTGRIRLVKTESSVSEIQTEEEGKAGKPHSWAFNEAVVISTLAKLFGKEAFPLGRKRYTKLSYLLHRHAEREAEGYLKKAAGPYNPRTKYGGPERIALEKGYIQQHQGPKGHSGFIAADDVAQAEGYFEKWYGLEALQWLEQFRFKKNDELEVLATVDMAAEELLASGKSVDVAAVKDVIASHPEWEAKLARAAFSDANVAEAIQQSERLFRSSGERSE